VKSQDILCRHREDWQCKPMDSPCRLVHELYIISKPFDGNQAVATILFERIVLGFDGLSLLCWQSAAFIILFQSIYSQPSLSSAMAVELFLSPKTSPHRFSLCPCFPKLRMLSSTGWPMFAEAMANDAPTRVLSCLFAPLKTTCNWTGLTFLQRGCSRLDC
jgi:hypothetical protein